MCSKIICFDLDMTLLDHRTFTVSGNVLAALKKLQQEGHIVTVATGRDLDNAFSVQYKELIHPTAIVHSNGQKVSVGDQKIREVFMEKELIRRLMDFARENGYCIGFNIGEYGCYVNKEIVMQHEQRVFGSSDRKYIDESNLLTHPFYALAYFGDPKGVDRMLEAFPEIKMPFFADKCGADLITKDVSKANGIQTLLDYYGKDWSDVIAFGDSMNDYEMIQKAGIGVAMGNAVEPLKEVADYVTLSVDGVCHGLRHLGLLSEE